jgi:uncharacterized damage-inducible protein DinB
MPDLRTDFVRHNEWANMALIDACRSLTEEQLDATSAGTFGSIRSTLHHIVSAEGGYATRLGHEPSPKLAGDAPWPGLDGLVEMVRAAADALAVASLEASGRVIEVGPEHHRREVDAGVILVQASHHGTDHRSQIATILTNLGIEPPDLSSWDWGLASGRMRDA